jgi:hypothetical protein
MWFDVVAIIVVFLLIILAVGLVGPQAFFDY